MFSDFENPNILNKTETVCKLRKGNKLCKYVRQALLEISRIKNRV